MVTWQGKDELERFFAQNSYLKKSNVNLPVIYADSYLKRFFPHQSVPTAVLLYQGKVQAITTTDYVTEESIMKLYNDEPVFFPLKDDFGKRELSDRDKKIGVTIMGYQNGVPYRGWTFEQDSLSGLVKSSLYNASVFAALKALASKLKLQQSLYIPRMDRVVWKVSDSTRYYNFDNDPYWDIANRICYERYDSIARPDSLQALTVLKDFETFFGVRIYNGKKRMQVLELRPIAVKTYKPPKGGERMTYLGTTVFAGMIDYGEQFPPILDRVKSDKKMEIYPYKSLEELNMQLAGYGIKAEYATAEMEVLVVEEFSEKDD